MNKSRKRTDAPQSLASACSLKNPLDLPSLRRQRIPEFAGHLRIYIPFLNLATISFAIPPPISVSVRSRQAGTETEREPSAMEALGPGKRENETSGPCLESVCANALLHWGPWLQRGLDPQPGTGENKRELRWGPTRVTHYLHRRQACVRDSHSLITWCYIMHMGGVHLARTIAMFT